MHGPQFEDVVLRVLRPFLMGDGLILRFERLVEFEQQRIGGFLVGHLLPVDHAVDVIDRAIVARIGQQDAAIEQAGAGGVLEFGFESDRRLIGEDLHVMIGDAAQHRAARHARQLVERGAVAAFGAQFLADIGEPRIVHVVGQVEQQRMRSEIARRGGIEIVDVGKGAVAQQAGPVVVGAHLHAAFVLADRRGQRFETGAVIGDIAVVEVVLRLVRAEISAQPVDHCVHLTGVLPNSAFYAGSAVNIGLKIFARHGRQARDPRPAGPGHQSM